MLDPANDLLPQQSSPTNSSVSSSDLDTESTGSFFHDRSTTLGTLMGVNFPAITFRDPSQRREISSIAAVSGGAVAGNAVGGGGRRRRKWWMLCGDEEIRPSSLGEFLEVERRFGDGVFYGATAEYEGLDGHQRNGRLLFADGRVLPPVQVDEGTSDAGSLCRFPVSLTGICSGCVG